MPNELIDRLKKLYPNSSVDDMLDWYEAATYYKTPFTPEAFEGWLTGDSSSLLR